MRTLLTCLMGALLASTIIGCGFKEEMQNVRETRKRVKNKLEEMQNRVGIEHETQLMIDAIYVAYRSCLEKQNKAPTSWQDLAGAPGLTTEQRVQLRNAKNQVRDIVWGAELANIGKEEEGSAKLMSIENPLMSQVIILQANGKVRMVAPNELNSIPPAK